MDHEKVNLASIHTLLMQLSEVFLAYNTVTSSEIESPRILLMDMSPSSVLAWVAMPASQIGLVGYPYDRRHLDEVDIIVAMSHPYNEKLGIPTAKKFLRFRSVLAVLERYGKPIEEEELARRLGLNSTELRSELDYLRRHKVIKRDDVTSAGIEPTIDLAASWKFTISLFQNICSSLFLKKDPLKNKSC